MNRRCELLGCGLEISEKGYTWVEMGFNRAGGD